MRYLGGLILVGLIAFYLGGLAPHDLFPDFSFPEFATSTDEILESVTERAKDVVSGSVSVPKTESPTTPVQSGDTGKRFMQNGVYVTVVEYSEAGFNPSKLEIARGEEVRFVNTDNETMLVAADSKLSSLKYAQLTMPTSVGKGGTWQISFVEPGLFSYVNINKPYRPSGQVFVK